MLTVSQLHGFNAGGSDKSVLGILQAAGLGSGLVFVVDAGDSRCYPGSGQDVFDATSNNNDFFLGTTSSAAADDPTFTGTAGALDETAYFAFDGADNICYNGTSTFDDTWSNADGAFTVLAVFWPNASTTHTLGGNATSAVGAGSMRWFYTSAEKVQINYSTNDLSGATSETSVTTGTTGGITLAAMSIAMSTTTAVFRINGSTDTATLFGSSCTGAPPKSWRIADDGLGNQLPANDRLYAYVAWSRALSSAELATAYTALKARRFTSLP
jgi:hypothetical protein